MRPRVTMVDIGRIAGVSSSTVSRALSNHPAIPEETRKHIQEIAEQMNYRVDNRARNFRLQRSQTIATVFPYQGRSQRQISDPFYLEILGAVTEELDRHEGYDVIVSRVNTEDDQWVTRYVQDKRVDGIILIDRAVKDKTIDLLQELGSCFVVWGPALPDQQYVSVGCDSKRGAISAVRHMVNLGRRKIALIGGNARMVETNQRYLGYRQGILECGLEYTDDLVAYTDFTPQASSFAVRGLAERHPDLDGVFVCSDFMAMAVMEVLRSLGRDVPQHVSVVGYDDISLAAYCTPRLTTIHQPIHEGGRLMAQKLFSLMDGRPTESLILPLELVVRDSCGAGPH
jgi:DNA-binding LacI/PurR family transcriptional regulator